MAFVPRIVARLAAAALLAAAGFSCSHNEEQPEQAACAIQVSSGNYQTGGTGPSLSGNHRYVRRGLKHEMTHMVQLPVIGPQNVIAPWTPCWFAEGLAEHESGGASSCASCRRAMASPPASPITWE
ncbi:MAG: hypothetical protein AB1505_35780, partial [Candidatus Latescibacterota bacterium]